MSRRQRQRGVALLAAVLVVALATVLIAGMLDRGEATLARSRNLLRAEQTWQLALGVEYWAQSILQRDQQESAGIDARGDLWARPAPPLPVPGGTVQGLLRDASGCLNLNALWDGAQINPRQYQRLQRLLLVLDMDEALADAILDWIDPDALPQPRGAEDAAYRGRQPSYLAANRPMAHISELRLVQGIDEQRYRALLPHVCARPDHSAEINLNFASPALWQSLDSRISETIARQLWRDGQARFANATAVADELDRLGVAEFQPGDDLVTISHYFVLDIEVDVDRLPFQFSALLYRDERGVVTLSQVRGRW